MIKLLWLKILLKDIDIRVNVLIKLYCDNKAVNLFNNSVLHDRMRRIEIDKYFSYEKILILKDLFFM